MNDSPTLIVLLLIIGSALMLSIHLHFSGKRRALEEEEEREQEREREEERHIKTEAIFYSSHVIQAIKEARANHNISKDVKSVYTHTFEVKSRSAFESFQFTKRIAEHIADNIEYYEDIYCKAMENREHRDHIETVIEEAESIPVDETVLEDIGITEDEYRLEELSMVNLYLKNAPVSEPSFVFEVRYESPAGKSTLQDQETIYMEDLLWYFEKVESIQHRKKTAAYQRQRITPKKRLEILTKDHFRCCLCGRGTSDGVELNVDHFIPVSKGGTSDDDNLWTLCWDCNIGKSDYEIPELQEMFDQAMMERD